MTTASNANPQQSSASPNAHLQTPTQMSEQLPATKQQHASLPLEKHKWPSWTGFSGKTLWDWLKLFATLLLPLVIALSTAWFSFQQNQTALQVSESQHASDQKIAQENRQADQAATADQQQQATLNTYLADMKDLIFNHGLATSQPGDPVRSLARAETLSTLTQLDGKRKGVVITFLLYAGLLTYDHTTGKRAIVPLAHADLSSVDLWNQGGEPIDLAGENFTNANLGASFFEYSALFIDTFTNANLSGAHLHGALLFEDDFGGADLSGADLSDTDLTNAYLVGANLSNANLKGAKVTTAELDQAKTLQGAIMPDGSKHP